MAASMPNFDCPTDWTDLLAEVGYTDLAESKVLIQNVGGSAAKLFVGGAAAPADNYEGFTLTRGQSWSGVSDRIWVRSSYPTSLAVSSED